MRKNPKKRNTQPIHEAHARVGAGLRKRREALGLSLKELGQMVGITPRYIGLIELGQTDTSITSLDAIATGLGMSMAELLRPIDAKPEAELGEDETAEIFRSVPEALHEAMLEILRRALKGRRS